MYPEVDWESIKDRHENIRGTFESNLPQHIGSEECAHSGDIFAGERIASKIKQIWVRYQKGIDAEPQSGRGRILATFCDFSGETWTS